MAAVHTKPSGSISQRPSSQYLPFMIARSVVQHSPGLQGGARGQWPPWLNLAAGSQPEELPVSRWQEVAQRWLWAVAKLWKRCGWRRRWHWRDGQSSQFHAASFVRPCLQEGPLCRGILVPECLWKLRTVRIPLEFYYCMW